MKLPYLFIAEFANGDKYEQGPEDVSMIYDECKTDVDYHTANVGAFKRYPEAEEKERWKGPCKSAFTDVLNYPSPVVKFTLVNVSDPSDRYSVDLRTGHFFIGAKEVRMHGFDDTPIREVELYYTRIKQKDLQLAASGEMQQLDERFESFRLGWRGIGPKGPFERIMEIDV